MSQFAAGSVACAEGGCKKAPACVNVVNVNTVHGKEYWCLQLGWSNIFSIVGHVDTRSNILASHVIVLSGTTISRYTHTHTLGG